MSLAASLFTAGLFFTISSASDSSAASALAPQDDAIPQTADGAESQLDDIVVEGRPLRAAASDFVSQVTAPVPGNGAAAWRQPLCIGIANLQRPAAEHIIDRISNTADRLGVEMGSPGCEPRVFIAFSTDANETARGMVASRIREFRIGLSGADLGDAALRRFQDSDRPIRWWHVSLRVNPDTGLSVQRLRGQTPWEPQGPITRPSSLGNNRVSTTGSMLRSPVRDDLAQVIVIVDVDQIAEATMDQLSGYLTMVALAQINPDGHSVPYDSILNLFAAPSRAPSDLTDWDIAYLQGVYGAVQNQSNGDARIGAVAAAMAQSVRNQQRGSSE